jgi:ketosteroid isomerase-like protein
MLEQNKRVACAFLQALGSGDAATLKSVMTEDAQLVTAGYSRISGTHDYTSIMGIGELLPKITRDGIRMEFLEITAEADRVSIRAQGHATTVGGEAYDNQYHFLCIVRDARGVQGVRVYGHAICR